MIGSIGHNRYVVEGVRARQDAVIVAVAPGPHEADVRGVLRQATGAGSTPKTYNDYREMLDNEPVDIVTIACHFSDHAAVAIDALDQGKHIFIEKPIATTLEDFERLSMAYSKTDGLHLSAMLGLRYDPAFMTAWRLVSHGAIGEVRLMNAQKSYKLGQRGEHYRARETFGGTIPWVGSHAIDWLPWMSGRAFSRVYATHSTIANRDHGDLETTALCQFTLENEVFGSVTLDYLRPENARGHGDDRIRVVGVDGIVEVIDGRVNVIDRDGAREAALEPARSIFGDLIDQVRGEGACMVSAEDAFNTTRACLLARQSADEGRVVDF